jgi:ferredoxin-type protein NapG
MTKPRNPPGPAQVQQTRKQKDRREFLRAGLLAAGVLGISLLGFVPVVRGTALRLRPPGALKTPLDEQALFAACIKCGQCVQVCPVQAIRLADLGDGFGIGVPYIEAREQACDFSCDGLQCVLACPTGALTHTLDYAADSRMGFARLTGPDRCLAVQGKGLRGSARGPEFKGLLRYAELDRWNPLPVATHPYDLPLCDLCVRQCPIEIRIAQCAAEDHQDRSSARVAQRLGNDCPPKHAIRLEPITAADGVQRMRPRILDGCVGCGVCEMICPVEQAAIEVDIHLSADTPLPAGQAARSG